MKLVKATLFIVTFFALFTNNLVLGQEVRIPLKTQRQPSDDLVFGDMVLSSEEAYRLQTSEENPVDLSRLNPVNSGVWSNRPVTSLDLSLDEMELRSGENTQYKGAIASNQGLFRFNVLSENNNGRVYTILLEKTLHTYLLRKNLLRKLGYIVPKMKYLKSINVEFESIEQRNNVLNNLIPEGTYGAPSRWIGKSTEELGEDQLIVTINDVIAFSPQESDLYNFAVNVPPKRLTARSMRSLAIPYSLLDLGESVNKFPWHVGKVDNESLVLPHFASGDLDTTYDDGLWIMRRLANLTREDFVEVVMESYFPTEVEKILVEKLISRRNSLVRHFTLIDEGYNELPYNEKLSFGDSLKEGKITKEDWVGYASRFAHGQPDSPFQDYEYFIFSKIQNGVLDALLDYANSELSAFDPSEPKLEFLQNQFNEGLEHYVETGEFLEFGVGTWFSPLLSGNLILSRDIVVGNYLGTDNMVQLADTIGAAVSVGGVLGIENVPYWPIASATGTISAVRTYTHLKPVKTLKASFKEPYKNMIVPLMKMNLKKSLDQLAVLPDQGSGDLSDDELDPRLKKIEDLITEISENLGVGESLLVMDRLTPQLMVAGGFNALETRFRLSGGTSGLIMRRLHLYRKDVDTINVYEDKGHGVTFSATANIDHYLPVIRLEVDKTSGKYKVKMHTVNINSDVEDNPKLFTNAKALHYLLEEGSSELLEVNQKPYVVNGDYEDDLLKFSFLVWRAKYLNGENNLEVTTPQMNTTNYVSLRSDSQSGVNYQAFIYDVLNFQIRKWSEGLPFVPQLSSDRFKNPGQTSFGVSETIGARYEARNNNGVLSENFLSLSSKTEGWSIKQSKLKDYIKDLNDKYGRRLFETSQVNDASRLRLFDISINLNIYEKGIEKLRSMNPSVIKDIASKYVRQRSRMCGNIERRNFNIRTASQFRLCTNLNNLIDKSEECHREFNRSGETVDSARCTMELAKKMMRDLEFQDFLEVLGEENIFLYGTINGFREDSEILNDPIESNVIGRVRSRFWNGPLNQVQDIMGIQGGEFHGSWIRESL